ncbi:hypothetical protein S40285_06073 [Stachybotrys chlorohalonatus IBT 40285]|uniref:Uncharacterized protein n=1 Tax=Stachybotrys chlorohalonatus (strain IBT 40285) TaxID=1283841 RepID=A0A084QK06_STAC4|nr:hypothetical protein S40285_06073 [Stachybotrys chlorohalonata IBT 40285]
MAFAYATDHMFDGTRGKIFKRKMSKRHKHFLFMFGFVTAHELCHAFVGYLSQQCHRSVRFTPPAITHIGYGTSTRGEAGRFFEGLLLGGSLQFYKDVNDDDRQACLIQEAMMDSANDDMQVGVAHILDPQGFLWKIDPEAIKHMVEEPRGKPFQPLLPPPFA